MAWGKIKKKKKVLAGERDSVQIEQSGIAGRSRIQESIEGKGSWY